jgi:transcriptional regulator with XRE-family HTH domain
MALHGQIIAPASGRVNQLDVGRHASYVSGMSGAAHRSTGPIPLADALRRRLRDLRVERELGQDEVAQMVHAAGPPWTRDVVAHVEAGTRRIGVEELVGVLAAFGIGLEEFLGRRHPPVEVGDGGVLTPHQLATVLQGTAPRTVATAAAGRRAGERLLPNARDAGERILEDVRLAERQAARALGISVTEVQALAGELWGRSFTEERDRRLRTRLRNRNVAVGARTAHRGWVSRRLHREMSEALPGSVSRP